jgi:type II secretory ATPase GspE/PulE/Tfp pilus assembly ATPase PilB-like protein
MAISFDEEKQTEQLKELHEREERELVQQQAAKAGLPYIDLIPTPIELDALRLIPEAKARAAEVAGFALLGKKVSVAVFSPEKKETRESLKKLTGAGYEVALHMAERKGLEKAWRRYSDLSFAREEQAGTIAIQDIDIAEHIKNFKTLADVAASLRKELASKKSARFGRMIELMLAGALALDASDIHWEPEETEVRVRLRLDGMLSDVVAIPHEAFSFILSRIKIVSGLLLNITDRAQDGRLSVKINGTEIEIRTSLIPGSYGESVVLRILNPKTIGVEMEKLGLHPTLRAVVEREIKKPNGMILTTGPTGSGKTTTLYAFLKYLYSPGVKVITIEDPIEYHLQGIVQTQVDKNEKYTFLGGLRSALRQDPDVIMVGEIRDHETASVALNASLTGHMVFSTLHTNNAAGTFPRLVDLGADPKIIGSAVTLALAQRLVRVLCPHCKKEVSPSAEERARIHTILAELPNGITPTQKEKIGKPKGCNQCSETGYKGRVGVFEGIAMDKTIENIIRENPSERDIRSAAKPQNQLTMPQDGILKVLAGITSLEEIERVVGFYE